MIKSLITPDVQSAKISGKKLANKNKISNKLPLYYIIQFGKILSHVFYMDKIIILFLILCLSQLY